MRGDLEEGGFWCVSNHAMVLYVQGYYYLFSKYNFMDCEIYSIIGIANSEFDIKGTVCKKLHLTPRLVLWFVPSGQPLRIHCISFKIKVPVTFFLIS